VLEAAQTGGSQRVRAFSVASFEKQQTCKRTHVCVTLLLISPAHDALR
jgi:hypothetical protein